MYSDASPLTVAPKALATNTKTATKSDSAEELVADIKKDSITENADVIRDRIPAVGKIPSISEAANRHQFRTGPTGSGATGQLAAGVDGQFGVRIGDNDQLQICIREFSESTDAAWNSYVFKHQQGTLFHGLEWKAAVEQTFGHKANYLIAQRGEQICGVFPLFEIKSLFAGRFLLSMPYATYGGIIADDDEATVSLFDAARKLAEEGQFQSLEMRSIDSVVSDLPASKKHAMFTGPLPDLVKDVPNVFPRKARAAARQATQRYPLTTTFDAADLTTVWQLYSRSMRRLGSPNYPLRFFKLLVDLLGNNCLVQLVRIDGKPAAGLVSFIFRDTVMPYFAGIDERLDIYGLSHYLYQQCMFAAVERRLKVFDFGRTRCDNKGAFDFKRHCGFEPTILGYQTFVPHGRCRPDLSPASARWSAARRVWRYLPLIVTQPLGAWVSRSIPG